MRRWQAGSRVLTAILVALIAGMTVGPAAVRGATSSTITLTDCPVNGGEILELWQAIIDANDESLYPGPTTIQLAPNCPYYYFKGPYPGTNYALPPITSAITIDGRGAFLTTGPRSGGDSYDVGGLFDVHAGGTLSAANLTLFDDFGAPNGGAIVTNAGTTTLDNVSIEGFDPMAVPALFNEAGATFTFRDSTVDHYKHYTATEPVGAAIENAGTFYAVGSDFINDGTEPYIDLVPRATRSILNNGYMELIDSRVHVDGGNYVGVGNWGLGILTTGTLVLRGSEVSGSFYPADGAGIYNTGTLQVESSSVGDNVAVESSKVGVIFKGGGIFNAGTARIVNSEVMGNVADDGADVYNALVGTVSFSDIGDIATSPLSLTKITGSILFSCEGAIQDGGFNLDANGHGCPGTYGYAMLEPWPHATGIQGGVSALGIGSAALDAGGTSCPSTDQRGFPRPAGAACDIGAYENQPPTAPTGLSLAAGANPGNTGDLTLSWGASTDADFDPITYALWGGTAGAVKETELFSGSSTSVDLTGLAEGTWSFRVAATDGRAFSPSATLSSVVVDRTPPSAPSATPDRAPDFTSPGGTGWYRDSVSVNFIGATDPLLADGSAPSGIASITPAQTFTTSGPHTATGTATDAAGNTSLPASLTVNVDADPPVIAFDTCPASVLLGHAATLSWTASDAESGLATPSSGQLSVDTSTVGLRTITASAADNVGHGAIATCAVNVIFDFSGFDAPVANAPSFNAATAGMVIPIRFSLAGNQGLSIFAMAHPATSSIACGSDSQLTTGDPTVSPYGLLYSGGTYTYLWQTDRSWSGTCRQLIVQLSDGTFHLANFSFN